MFNSSEASSTPFGARSTADQVLAGIDLSNRVYVVTGCDSGIGLATLQALAANGATVIGLARTLAKAADACESGGPACKPVGCDLADLSSVRAASETMLQFELPIDGVVANAGVAGIRAPQSRYGVDEHFLVNYLSQTRLIELLLDRVRDGTGRIVVTSSRDSLRHAPDEHTLFEDLDGSAAYDPAIFYGRSKLALEIYAKELSRRLRARGIAVNAAEPGRTRDTGIDRHRAATLWSWLPFARWAMKSPGQGAATQCMLLASPRVAGVTGEYWRDCQIASGHPLAAEESVAGRLWELTQSIVANAGAANSRSFKVAA